MIDIIHRRNHCRSGRTGIIKEEEMKLGFRTVPVALGAALLFVAPAHARNYDCSKAGNANKAVCKGAAAAVPATPAPAAAPETKAATATTTRHYDCSKAGNANKAMCKGATAAPAASPAPMPGAPSRSSVPMAPAATRASVTHSSAPATTSAAGPNGATAMCNDGSYSHSAHRSGTCSGHKGVKSWY